MALSPHTTDPSITSCGPHILSCRHRSKSGCGQRGKQANYKKEKIPKNEGEAYSQPKVFWLSFSVISAKKACWRNFWFPAFLAGMNTTMMCWSDSCWKEQAPLSKIYTGSNNQNKNQNNIRLCLGVGFFLCVFFWGGGCFFVCLFGFFSAVCRSDFHCVKTVRILWGYKLPSRVCFSQRIYPAGQYFSSQKSKLKCSEVFSETAVNHWEGGKEFFSFFFFEDIWCCPPQTCKLLQKWQFFKDIWIPLDLTQTCEFLPKFTWFQLSFSLYFLFFSLTYISHLEQKKKRITEVENISDTIVWHTKCIYFILFIYLFALSPTKVQFLLMR